MDPTPATARSAAQILSAGCAVLALITLGLPFAEKYFWLDTHKWMETFTGFTIGSASRMDGHRPVPVAVAVIVIAGTVLLAALAWAAVETDRSGISATAAVLAVALVFFSMPALSGIDGEFGAGHDQFSAFGIGLWRLMLVACGVLALRACPRPRDW
ncbi:hypothetical protein EK0264_05170 [Epidermidibacterium keratini]|uniref:Uncharacterized protein n=1 Tax=Epidermidibacterium keratini TaxID=1891644 RepID=A0A7L4YKZ5_9ACTN|nr:hypothetical protein [Epidermidibacterium keratini]QHB99731.1 hypothetical protein EK0264_05170 [Epidermidibacterium keratini]